MAGLQGDPEIVSYTFDFNVQAVPEPSAIILFALGTAALLAARRRRG